MIQIPELRSYAERYAALPLEPLRVTVTLRQAMILYDPLYLDNLLARAILEMARGHAILDNTPEPYEFLLPLKCIWTAENGCPLWAASVFLPDGKTIADTVYLHKRLERLEFSERQPKSNVGRWMDRRIPYQTQQTETLRWYALCIGNAEEIAALLPLVRFLGKRRNVGFGEVAEWEIERWNGGDLDTLVQDGRLIHALPEEGAGSLGICPNGPTSLIGWTPPQWKPSLFSMGWMAGVTSKLPVSCRVCDSALATGDDGLCDGCRAAVIVSRK
jgi:hypothetical protein